VRSKVPCGRHLVNTVERSVLGGDVGCCCRYRKPTYLIFMTAISEHDVVLALHAVSVVNQHNRSDVVELQSVMMMMMMTMMRWQTAAADGAGAERETKD